MYSTCLHCHHSLGKNEAIEHFPVGRRLAFDAAKGRLWVVCAHCGRWNLTPVEERWEAVEEAEQLFRAQRLRAQTDNIGLTKLREGTELIRVGAPLRPEFAAWRYGGIFRQRLYRRTMMYAAGGSALGAGVIAASGVLATAAQIVVVAPFLTLPLIHIGLAATMSRGGLIRTTVLGLDGKPLRVTAANLDHTRIIAAENEAITLHLKHSYGSQLLTGDRAQRALATLLAQANRRGGTTSTITDAADFIADAGNPHSAIVRIATEADRRAGDFEERATEFARGAHGKTMREALAEQLRIQQRARKHGEYSNTPPRNPGALHRLPRTLRLALEMSLHETSEQNALEEDLSLLERDWREAEEIAAIADNLLAPHDTTASA